MYRMKVAAAEDTQDTRLQDSMSALKDDFNYLMDTIDKLDRDGKPSDALQICENISSYINEAISSSTESI